MGKLFDFIGYISYVFDWFLNFLKAAWQIISTVYVVGHTVLTDCPPALLAFFSIFMVLAVVMFVWRLIP